MHRRAQSEMQAHAPEFTPRAPELTPRAPELTPRAPEFTPRAPDFAPRAPKFRSTSQHLPHGHATCSFPYTAVHMLRRALVRCALTDFRTCIF
eukprot:1188410-Prorocentrum_minimum.AAC.2